MAQRGFEISSAQMAVLTAFLPGDLTEKQTDKVLEAATLMAAEVWREAQSVAIQKHTLLREAQMRAMKNAEDARP